MSKKDYIEKLLEKVNELKIGDKITIINDSILGIRKLRQHMKVN